MSADLPNPGEIARYILAKAQVTSPPVDLIRITQLWPKLHVVEEQINNEGYVVCLGVHGGEIILKASDTAQRKRYTLAHELGHWVLSNGVDALMPPACHAIPHGYQEKWCDQFAAELLMPSFWILEHLRSAKISGLARAISSLPQIYNTSKQAMFIRVPEIAPLNLYIFSQVGRTIKRFEHRSFSISDSMRLGELAEAAVKRDWGQKWEFVALDEVGVATGYRLRSRWIVAAFFRA